MVLLWEITIYQENWQLHFEIWLPEIQRNNLEPDPSSSVHLRKLNLFLLNTGKDYDAALKIGRIR